MTIKSTEFEKLMVECIELTEAPSEQFEPAIRRMFSLVGPRMAVEAARQFIQSHPVTGKHAGNGTLSERENEYVRKLMLESSQCLAEAERDPNGDHASEDAYCAVAAWVMACLWSQWLIRFPAQEAKERRAAAELARTQNSPEEARVMAESVGHYLARINSEEWRAQRTKLWVEVLRQFRLAPVG